MGQLTNLSQGAGTGGATKSVLETIGSTMSSYTYTDISAGFFNKASELFSGYAEKMIFKTLDVEKDPTTQGYQAHSYDILLASNVLHATVSLQKTLENARKLLKPGGYLLMLEITNQGPTRFGNVMAGLPGWWLGVDDGRKWAPTVTPTHWHRSLRRSGFAGVDAITSEVDGVTWPLSIIAAQAVDERVEFLRRPLGTSSRTAIQVDNLVILGNKEIETALLAEELHGILSPFCREVTILDGLPKDEEAQRLKPMSVFVNLVDLDSPIFKNVTAEKMRGLQWMFERAKQVLWVTQNAQIEQPYHMASIAFSRVIRNEHAHISLQHLDISGQQVNAAKSIAECVLQQAAIDTWTGSHSQQEQPLLWSQEPEMFLTNGELMIPRLVSHQGQNNRLNAAKRAIYQAVSLVDSNVSLKISDGLIPGLVEATRPSASCDDSMTVIRAETSSIGALLVAPDTHLFYGIGMESSSQSQVLYLSSTNSLKVNPVASVKIGGHTDAAAVSSDDLCAAVGGELLSNSVLGQLSPKSHLLICCPGDNSCFVNSIIRQAQAKEVKITFVGDGESSTSGQAPSIKLDLREPLHVLRTKLRRIKPTHYLDLTTTKKFERFGALPSDCRRIDRSKIIQPTSSLLSVRKQDLIERLSDIVARVYQLSASAQLTTEKPSFLRIDQVKATSVFDLAAGMIKWPSGGSVEVEVRPQQSQFIFSPDKTYLLIGLTGKIGQSLCEWMVANGAGCVCLTSRRPQIDSKWLESFQGTRATVKIYPMDVTNRSMMDSVIKDIRATCPPIGGLANGAMVLHDALFANMSMDEMRQVLGPKIDGSQNLDDIFREEPLDFFIILSSSASVIGNSGQSNYAAANGYINSLVRQRRRRGFAASTLDIGRVVGIGYVETAGEAVSIQLARMGLAALSEPDLRRGFAETITAGYVSPNDQTQIPQAVVTSGIRTIREDEEIKGPWFSNPFFSHCIVGGERANSASKEEKENTRLPARQQLARATTQEEALDILQRKSLCSKPLTFVY